MGIFGWMKNSEHRSARILILLACAAACALLNALGFFTLPELKTLDWRFRLRDTVLPGASSSLNAADKIAIIEISDDSMARLPEPLILWDGHFARVADALTRNGAKVTAIDVLWLKSIEDFVELKGESPRKALVRVLLRAAGEGRLVLAAVASAETAGAGQAAGGESLGKYAAVIGRENFGIINPQYDKDKIIRRQRRYYRDAEDAEALLPSFALLAASRYTEKEAAPTDGSFLIDYCTGPFPFPRFPFHEVLAMAQSGNAGYFRRNFGGRLVFLGTNTSLQDRFPTPMGKETPGLYSHAFAAATLLGGRGFSFPSPAANAALPVLLSLAAGLLVFGSQPLRGALASAYLAALYTAAAAAAFFYGAVLPMAAPLAAALLTALASFAHGFLIVDRKKRRVEKMLKSYLNDRAVEKMLESRDHSGLKGERRQVCVLFADIRGFTELSETLPPEKVVSLLNRYLSAMSKIILDHGGNVDKFIGDGIMAYFGASEREHRPALKAVRTALAMQDRLGRLNDRWEKHKHLPLKIGIGIHQGEAVIGNIGSFRKLDYTVIGDTVNLASRIEGLTKEYGKEILVTEEVLGQVKDHVEYEELGRSEVRGHSPVELYAVSGVRKDRRQS